MQDKKNTARLGRNEKKDLLRAAALRVMARHGIEGASTRAIALEAQQNVAAIHYAFESKDDLLMSIPKALQLDVEQILHHAVKDCDDAKSAIAAIANAYWHYTLSDPDSQRVHYELTLFALSKPKFESIAQQQYINYRNTVSKVLTLYLDEQLEAEQIETLASVCLAVMDGIIIQYLATKNEGIGYRALQLGIHTMQEACP